jgi:hypothetical protein
MNRLALKFSLVLFTIYLISSLCRLGTSYTGLAAQVATILEEPGLSLNMPDPEKE